MQNDAWLAHEQELHTLAHMTEQPDMGAFQRRRPINLVAIWFHVAKVWQCVWPHRYGWDFWRQKNQPMHHDPRNCVIANRPNLDLTTVPSTRPLTTSDLNSRPLPTSDSDPARRDHWRRQILSGRKLAQTPPNFDTRPADEDWRQRRQQESRGGVTMSLFPRPQRMKNLPPRAVTYVGTWTRTCRDALKTTWN